MYDHTRVSWTMPYVADRTISGLATHVAQIKSAVGTKIKEFLRKTSGDGTLLGYVCACSWACMMVWVLTRGIPFGLRVAVTMGAYPALMVGVAGVICLAYNYCDSKILRKNIRDLRRVSRTKFRDLEQRNSSSSVFRQDIKLYSFFKNGVPHESALSANLSAIEKYYARKLSKRYHGTLTIFVADLQKQIRSQTDTMCECMGPDWTKDETMCVWYIRANPEQLNVKYLILSYCDKSLKDNVQGTLIDYRQRLVVAPRWVYDVVISYAMTEPLIRPGRIPLECDLKLLGECVNLYDADMDFIYTMFDSRSSGAYNSLEETVAAASVI